MMIKGAGAWLALVGLALTWPASALAQTAAATGASGASAEQELPAAKDQRSIGFSNLIVRVEKSDEIGIASGEVRVHILEDLRRRGLNAVGAENLVFGRDESEDAELILGGTVTELKCQPGKTDARVSCRIGVEWQVLDVASGEVVYKVTSRRRVLNMLKEPASAVGRELVLKALGSLTERSELRKLLRRQPAKSTVSGYSSVALHRCPAAARSMPSGSEDVLNATALVQTSAGFGSGFVLGPEGYLVTAAHVVPGSSATVRMRDGREFPASVIRADRRLDIALLRVALPAGTELPCLSAKLDPLDLGADLYAIGSPASRELSFSLARGILSGVRLLDGVQYLQTDAAINRGNSGGPLITSAGEAAAVVSFKLVGKTTEGLAFGVPLGAGLGAIGVSLSDDPTSAELATAGAMPPAAAHTAFVDKPDPIPALHSVKRDKAQAKAHTSAGAKKGLIAVGVIGLVVGAALFATAQNADNPGAQKTMGFVSGGLGGMFLILGGSLK